MDFNLWQNTKQRIFSYYFAEYTEVCMSMPPPVQLEHILPVNLLE